jgi:hypothetical protein
MKKLTPEQIQKYKDDEAKAMAAYTNPKELTFDDLVDIEYAKLKLTRTMPSDYLPWIAEVHGSNEACWDKALVIAAKNNVKSKIESDKHIVQQEEYRLAIIAEHEATTFTGKLYKLAKNNFGFIETKHIRTGVFCGDKHLTEIEDDAEYKVEFEVKYDENGRRPRAVNVKIIK